MRYERKYILTPLVEGSVSSFLRNQSFKEQYKQRYVNSLYYDDLNFRLFVDSERGSKNRKKIRCRFYDFDDKVTLEYKNKSDELGYKSYPDLLNKRNLIPLLTNKLKISKSLLFPSDIDLFYKPKVLISYKRRYFISPDRGLRITLDKKIKFSKSYISQESIKISNQISSENDVLEIKYDYDYEPSLVFLNKLTSEFGLNISRFSKYCQAINTLY